MWHQTFADRLAAWNQLRTSTANLPVGEALAQINSWWFNAPWQPYYLHWDDRQDWPDPWQLLSDNIYCPLARGLGIMYTIAMLDRPDLQDCTLAEVGGDNLVLINKEKYILNWDKEEIVNINLGTKHPRHQIAQSTIKQIIK